MIYKVYLYQTGGCDYTIGCGETVRNISAESMDEAKDKLFEMIKKDYSSEERTVESAQIFEIQRVADIDLTQYYSKIEAEREERQRKADEEREKQQYEALKKKYES